jgi:hypothetical protein
MIPTEIDVELFSEKVLMGWKVRQCRPSGPI